jgi:hypothetical protein
MVTKRTDTNVIVKQLSADVIRAVKDVISTVQWMQDNVDATLNSLTEFRACTANITNEQTRSALYAIVADVDDYNEFVTETFPTAVTAYKAAGGSDKNPGLGGIAPRKGATA